MTNDNLDPAMVEWSRQRFEQMADGGAWAVPRSGMIFVRRGERLELTARMPYVVGMPVAKDVFREQQRLEFESIERHFKAAGIAVIDVSKDET
jgi:hypothetical protein